MAAICPPAKEGASGEEYDHRQEFLDFSKHSWTSCTDYDDWRVHRNVLIISTRSSPLHYAKASFRRLGSSRSGTSRLRDFHFIKFRPADIPVWLNASRERLLRAPRPLRLRLRCQRENRCRSKVRHKCRPYHRPFSFAPGGQDSVRPPLRCSRPLTCFPPSALPRPLRGLRLFPPTRPAAGRPAAAAAHRAAVVVCSDIDGESIAVGGHCLLYQVSVYISIGDIDTTAIESYSIYGVYLYLSTVAIGDFETFDDSRLTAKMGVSGMRMSCKARSIEHSTAPERLCCGNGGRKADSCGIYAGKPAQKPSWVYYAPRCRQSRHRRAGLIWKEVCSQQPGTPVSSLHPISPRPRWGEYRPGTFLRGTGSAKNPCHNIIPSGL